MIGVVVVRVYMETPQQSGKGLTPGSCPSTGYLTLHTLREGVKKQGKRLTVWVELPPSTPPKRSGKCENFYLELKEWTLDCGDGSLKMTLEFHQKASGFVGRI